MTNETVTFDTRRQKIHRLQVQFLLDSDVDTGMLMHHPVHCRKGSRMMMAVCIHLNRTKKTPMPFEISGFLKKV